MTEPTRTRNVPGTEGRKAVAALVVDRRGELGLTQEEFAAKAGVSPRALQDLEAGKTWPQARTLAAIARALGVTSGYLRYVADGQPAKAS